MLEGVGYRGKVEERQRARDLRARSWTLQEIATELGVSKGSVSLWVRDVDFEPRPRNRGHPAGPKHPMRLRKEAEIERCRVEAEQWAAGLTDRDLEMFVLGLYAGEGSKTDGEVAMANTNPAYLRLFLRWLRNRFDIDERRLRAIVYLHDGLDIADATALEQDARHPGRSVHEALPGGCGRLDPLPQARQRLRDGEILQHGDTSTCDGADRRDILSIR